MASISTDTSPQMTMARFRCPLAIEARTAEQQQDASGAEDLGALRIIKYSGDERATVAIPRKLLSIMHRMCVVGSEFQFGKAPADSRKRRCRDGVTVRA